jgi:hypothetical protein
MPKVSTFPDASTPLSDADVLYAVQGGNSRKTTVSGLKTVLAPLPKSAAGVGQWVAISAAVSTAAVLPAGGTWAYMIYRFNAGVVASSAAGVAAGGATIGAATGGQNWNGFAWRVS